MSCPLASPIIDPRSGVRFADGVEAMAETVAYKYRAFISYSHADTAWAKWLHRALENLTIDKDLVGRETAAGTIPTTLVPSSATATTSLPGIH